MKNKYNIRLMAANCDHDSYLKSVTVPERVWAKLVSAAGDMDRDIYSRSEGKEFAAAVRRELGRPRHQTRRGGRGLVPVFCARPDLEAVTPRWRPGASRWSRASAALRTGVVELADNPEEERGADELMRAWGFDDTSANQWGAANEFDSWDEFVAWSRKYVGEYFRPARARA